ncbi:hypothetical protein XA68_10915 [Ophiocordyceps unilateralis]|uniref:Uncharacterized protein n=1 Tax=Ophiocordyceps unilateralis TaxID=268505 RepID=A0A2A9NY04_OPHUN|nr:hypothetical protein XA68_10915 [Ophiocordyceps unilateralis]
MPTFPLGQSIPPDTDHAISVSLPTWESNVGYEEGQEWVVKNLTTGYPRPGQRAMLFATARAAARCLDYIEQYAMPAIAAPTNSLDFAVDASKLTSRLTKHLPLNLHAAFFHHEAYPLAKQYWQHTGDGISSRRAEFLHNLLKHRTLVPRQLDDKTQTSPQKGPRRYQKSAYFFRTASADVNSSASRHCENNADVYRFLEERFGRNLDPGLVEQAKVAIRRRIAGSLANSCNRDTQNLPSSSESFEDHQAVEETDVFLFPSGMNAIFHVHRTLLEAFGQLQSVNYGFPYVDTLKILQKFGPGCLFLGRGSSDDLDDLETLLRSAHTQAGR